MEKKQKKKEKKVKELINEKSQIGKFEFEPLESS